MNTEVFRWKFGIGDPTFEGWAISLLYLLTAILSFRKYKSHHRQNRPDYQLWGIISFLLFFLSLNKQLDLQTIVSDVGRWIAINLEMMEQRHIFKRVFILSIFILGLIISVLLRKNIYNFIRSEKVTFLGMLTLLTFIFLRATSFHIFSDSFNGILLNLHFFQIMEISAIAIIAISLISFIQPEHQIN